ncbi:MAG: DUF4910 domain-containing protein [Lentisphaeria bacterium]|nr:DUF4910 domain-containing protein [Lentisphaeria bacterium]
MQYIRAFYDKLAASVDENRLWQDMKEITECEVGQTFSHYRLAAECALKKMREAGFSHCELLEIPADGKSVFLDKTMPLAWDVTKGKLSVISGEGFEVGEVLADYEKHPFSIVKGSVATKEGGEKLKVVTEKDFLAGKDVKDSLVLLEQNTWPRAHILNPVLEKGGRGLISCFSKGAEKFPESIQWVVASTSGPHWHPVKGDKDFISFSISLSLAERLRKSASEGDFYVLAECDGKRYEGVLPFVTGIIPGKRKEEVWLSAHLYEPLADDNSTGVSAVIESARTILANGTPEFTVRLLFGMEVYGFAAYASMRGLPLNKDVLGGINYDGVCCKKIGFYPAGGALPWYGNIILKMIYDSLKDHIGSPALAYTSCGRYFDDISISDPTVGVPAVWPLNMDMSIWHNSSQTPESVDKKLFKDCALLNILFANLIASPVKEMMDFAVDCIVKELEDFKSGLDKYIYTSHKERFLAKAALFRKDMKAFSISFGEEFVNEKLKIFDEKVSVLAQDLSDDPADFAILESLDKKIASRLSAGLPNDLKKVPPEERKPIGVMYDPLAVMFAEADGRRSVKELLLAAEYQSDEEWDEEGIKKMLDRFMFFVKWGYIGIKE